MKDGDRNEGTFPDKNYRAYKHAIKVSLQEQNYPHEYMPEVVEPLTSLMEKFLGASSAMLPYWVANCWHIDEGECEQMWQKYVPDGKGVAIKTTLKRLTESFDNAGKRLYYPNNKEIPVHAGMVQYIDREKQWISYDPVGWGVALHKEEKDFEEERELRVVADLTPTHFGLPLRGYVELVPYFSTPDILRELHDNGGIFIPVELSTLIDKVVVSPSAPPDLRQRVEGTLRDKHINAAVEMSGLKI